MPSIDFALLELFEDVGIRDKVRPASLPEVFLELHVTPLKGIPTLYPDGNL